MTILVDMDDTIEQLLQAWVREINKQYDQHLAYEDVLTWDISEVCPELTKEQVMAIPFQPGFWRTVDPVPGAAEALQRLMDAGHEIFIVTATYPESVPEKMNDLLFKYFPFLTWDQVIITRNKQMIRGDVLIDDGIHNLVGGDFVKVLMTAPHNKNYDAEANGMIRVNNWTEIENLIPRIEEKLFMDTANRVLEDHRAAFEELSM